MKDAKKRDEQKKPTSTGHKVLTVIGIVLCVLLVPILIVNVTLLIKGVVNKDAVPSFGSYSPLIVLTDSMYPTIQSGDLILIKQIDPLQVREGDVISFFDPSSSSGTAVVTHRVLKQNVTEQDGFSAAFNPENEPGIETVNGKLIFRTQGDYNNTPDRDPIPAENLVGVWRGIRFAGLGKVALWLQSTPGLIVCVAVPILLLVGYDLIRRRRYEASKKQDTDALLKELEALRAAQSPGEQNPAEPSAEPSVEKVPAETSSPPVSDD